MGIQFKLIVLILVVVAITSGFTVLVSRSASNDMLRDQISDHLISTAQAKAQHIETIVKQRMDNTELFAQQAQAFETLLGGISLLNNPPSLAMASQILKQMADSQESLDTVFLIGPDGIVMGSSDSERFHVGKDLSSSPVFQKAQTITYVGPADLLQTQDQFELCTAAPVSMTGAGAPAAVLVQLGGTQELLNIIADTTGLGDTGRVYLIDSDGFMIRSVGGVAQRKEIDLESTDSTTHDIVEPEGETPEYRSMSYTNYLGVDVYGVHAGLPHTGWTVVVEIASSEAFAPVETQAKWMLWVFAAALLIAILLAVLLSRTISKPIFKLQQGVEQIVSGNLDYTVGSKSQDEIGELSRAFDAMTVLLKKSKARVEEYSANLERKVEERTKDISVVNERLSQEIADHNRAEDEIKRQNEDLQAFQTEQQKLLRDLEEQNRIIRAAHTDLGTALEAATTSQGRLQLKNDELMALQQELREINQHLEEKVEERTAEITRLLAQKGEFVSQLGHDLRSPLTPLVALVPLLREKAWDAETEKIVDVISRNVQYMKNLVEKTLMLATLDVRDISLSTRDVSVSRLVYDLLRRKQYETTKPGISVVNQIGEDIIVRADELRLVEVLDNLASNAVKFMPAGGTLMFDAEGTGAFATVSVTDTGIGLTTEQSRHVFREFYKADESRRDLGSVGLGLTICKRIVEQHGGRMWLRSEGLGKGTTFFFTLPLAKTTQASAARS